MREKSTRKFLTPEAGNETWDACKSLALSLPRKLLFLTCVWLLTCSLPANAAELAWLEPTSLCSSLQTIQAGDVLRVRVEGVMTSHGQFFDHREPHCVGMLSTIFSEPAQGYEYPEELRQLLSDKGEAFVSVVGELHGPIPGLEDDPAVHVLAAVVGRRALKGYGTKTIHISRTKLVVQDVQVARPTSEAPQNYVFLTFTAFPQPVRAELPTEYPKLALALELEGQVKVQLDVKDGEVAELRVLSGDRTLLEETVGIIKTWRFAKGVQARFTTTFDYRFGTTRPGSKVDVMASLPLRVEVTARRRNW